MRGGLRVAVLLGGLVLLAPAIGQSAVVYRVSGAGCTPVGDGFDYAYLGSDGLVITDTASVASCALPTSDSTFTANTLETVNVRYYLGGSSTNVSARLYVHDHDSFDYVECDYDADANVSSSFGQLSLQKDCAGYDSTWGIMVRIHAANVTSTLVVKLITAYD